MTFHRRGRAMAEVQPCAAAPVAVVQPHLLRMADAYPAEARFTPDAVRKRLFTVDQQTAWALRFGEGARP